MTEIADLENPGLLLRILLWIDPAIFYSMMLFFKGITFFVDIFLDLLFGYTISYGSKEERLKSKQYEHSAHRVKVLGRGALSILHRTSLTNYFWKHEEYFHPRYILEHDSVTLQALNKDYALFCIKRDKNFDIYDSTIVPFLFVVQYLVAEELIILPLSSFHRLAEEEAGDPKYKSMTMLHMTARCGSTLVCNFMARVPKVRAMSEPWSLAHLHQMYAEKDISYDEYRRLLRNTIRLQFKNENNTEIDHLFVKMSHFATPCTKYVKEDFPQMKFMFITRMLMPALKSFRKVVNGQPFVFVQSGSIQRWYTNATSFPYDEAWWKRYDKYRSIKYTLYAYSGWLHEVHSTFSVAGSLQCYLNDIDLFSKAIIFEDLKANPREGLTDIFNIIGIDTKHIDNSLEALKTDSQKGTFGKLGSENLKISEAILDLCDEMFAECGINWSRKTTLPELRKLLKIK